MDMSEALRVARQLAATANAAAPAPWFITHADAVGYMSATFVTSVEGDGFPGANHVIAATHLAPDWATHEQEEENAEFIVAARNGVSDLASLVESMVLERRELRESLRSLLAYVESVDGVSPEERDRALAAAKQLLASSD